MQRVNDGLGQLDQLLILSVGLVEGRLRPLHIGKGLDAACLGIVRCLEHPCSLCVLVVHDGIDSVLDEVAGVTVGVLAFMQPFLGSAVLVEATEVLHPGLSDLGVGVGAGGGECRQRLGVLLVGIAEDGCAVVVGDGWLGLSYGLACRLDVVCGGGEGDEEEEGEEGDHHGGLLLLCLLFL